MPSPDPVVSNTTPLIKLVGVGLLDLLPTLYQENHVPEAVFAESGLCRKRSLPSIRRGALNTPAVLILRHSPG